MRNELRDCIEDREVYSFKDLEGLKKIIENESGNYYFTFKKWRDFQGAEEMASVCAKCQLNNYEINTHPAFYTGIANKSLYDRIQQHYIKRSSTSTLRRGLSVLLEESIGTKLRVYDIKGKGKKYTLEKEIEEKLDMWMKENAIFYYQLSKEYDDKEKEMIKKYKFPMNIQHNNKCCCEIYKKNRGEAQKEAGNLPPVS